MSKVDYQKWALPDIEMYAGSTDIWDFYLYDLHMQEFKYDEVENYNYRLVIKDYGYTHRSNGTTYFTLTKTGTLRSGLDNAAVARFTFDKEDTFERYGKYTYQVEAYAADKYFSAQGNLFIVKNINQ